MCIKQNSNAIKQNSDAMLRSNIETNEKMQRSNNETNEKMQQWIGYDENQDKRFELSLRDCLYSHLVDVLRIPDEFIGTYYDAAHKQAVFYYTMTGDEAVKWDACFKINYDDIGSTNYSMQPQWPAHNSIYLLLEAKQNMRAEDVL